MKTTQLSLAIVFAFALFPFGAQAFVVPMEFEEKCQKAEAILRVSVEAVETLDLTAEIPWQFRGLARCRVISSIKGKADDSQDEFIFIPCEYPFDESPCPIREGKEYLIFLETMGNFSRFGHPIGPLCCHEITDGKVAPGIPGKESIKIEEFVRLIKAELEKQFFEAGNQQFPPSAPAQDEQDRPAQPAAAGKSKDN